jgi:hypothetical protein
MAGKDAYALIVQMSADTAAFRKDMKKAQVEMTKSLDEIRKAAGQVEKAAEMPGVKKAMESISGSARQRALESGSARLGMFGEALGALGPIGLAAAGGVGAFGTAVAGALAAARYADELADTANKIHVTTDALQEYRYALRLAGGEEKGADQALESFSVTLGKAQEGMARAQRGFIKLGFGPEQIAAFRTSEEALTAVTLKLAEIESNPRRDALISLLGLDSMKPLIQGGVEEMERLRQAARDSGMVMDAELVKRGAEVNDQFETLSQVVDVQLKSALVSLGPAITPFLNLLAGAAKFAGDIADQFLRIENRRLDGLRDLKVNDQEVVTRLGLKQLGGQKLSGAEQTLLAQRRARLARTDAEIARRTAEAGPTIPRAGPDLGEVASGGRTSRARAAGRPAQPLKTAEVFDPEILEILQALDYWQSVETRGNALRPTLDVSGDFIATLDEQLQAARGSTYDALYDGVRSGLEAGFYGGVPGMVDYLRSQLMRALMDSLARSLSEAVVGSGGGGSGGWIKSAVMSVLTGSFATGTSFAPGGMALVGERGPEVVNLPRGSTVTPHGIADIRPRGGSAPVVIQADFRGAVVTEELLASFRDYADQVGAQAAAEGAARGAAEAQARIYTRARNRLGR